MQPISNKKYPLLYQLVDFWNLYTGVCSDNGYKKSSDRAKKSYLNHPPREKTLEALIQRGAIPGMTLDGMVWARDDKGNYHLVKMNTLSIWNKRHTTIGVGARRVQIKSMKTDPISHEECEHIFQKSVCRSMLDKMCQKARSLIK